jgi:predicted N-acetyltransferase YhbS
MPEITYLTAETKEGRAAIEAVIARSYAARIDHVPPEWAIARLVDGDPVAFALVTPNYLVELPRSFAKLGFLSDVATSDDRRHSGHFAGILEEVSRRLVAADVPALLLHGDEGLYRRFGFAAYTHHSGVFLTPGQIASCVGIQDDVDLRGFRLFAEGTLPELLVAQYPACRHLDEAIAVLQVLAGHALALGKSRILLEEPTPSSQYLVCYHRSIDTPLIQAARMCGGEHVVAGSDPAGRRIAHADWIRVLDAQRLVEQFLAITGAPKRALGAVTLRTEAGVFSIIAENGVVDVPSLPANVRHAISWPAKALAQLVMGYQSAAFLSCYYDAALPGEALTLLNALFPRRWRFSRNESWVYPA